MPNILRYEEANLAASDAGEHSDLILPERLKLCYPGAMTTTATIIDTNKSLVVSLPRMKKSYWEDLDESTKESCRGKSLPQSYDGKAAWTISGRLCERWQDELHLAMKSLCNDNPKKVYSKDSHTSASASFQLLLLGPTGLPAAAKPVIVVSCSSLRKASSIVDLLKKHEKISKLKLGFGFLAHKEQITILAGTVGSGSASLVHNAPLTTACGLRIISSAVPVHRESEGKRSTLGGVLLLGGHYYGLTVAHTLLHDFGYEDSGNSSSDDTESLTQDSADESDIADEDIILNPLSITYPSTISAVYLENQNRLNVDPTWAIRESFDSRDFASGISLVGHMDGTSQGSASTELPQKSRWLCLDSDWALIEIQDSRFMLPNTFVVNGTKSTVRSFCPKQNPADGELVILKGNKNAMHTAGSGAIAAISLPWSRDFVDVWIMQFPSARGDCGTWVVDAQSGSLFGVVIASSADSNFTYVLPAEDIIESILARWKNRVTSFSDLFPLVAASSDNVRGFELAPYYELVPGLLDEGQIISGMHLPASGEFAYYSQYIQREEADSESTRSSSTVPSTVFEQSLRHGRAPSMSSNISHAQSVRHDIRSNLQTTNRSIREVEKTLEPEKARQRDTERERSGFSIKEQEAELPKRQATTKDMKTQQQFTADDWLYASIPSRADAGTDELSRPQTDALTLRTQEIPLPLAAQHRPRLTSESFSDPPGFRGAARGRHGHSAATHMGYVEPPMAGLLDSRYTIRPTPAGFFVVGRVFATIWHASFSRLGPAHWSTQDEFGEHILTHIQRLAVVREGHGFSWCVPINTYNGKGVAKTGFNEADRRAHAIIYMEGTDVQVTGAEKGMMIKKPIAVRPAGVDQKLDVMSRINFAKVHTIEHNVKVMDVGRISRDDMRYFIECWREQTRTRS